MQWESKLVSEMFLTKLSVMEALVSPLIWEMKVIRQSNQILISNSLDYEFDQ